MNIVTCKTFRANITVGLHKGYTNDLISWQIFKNEITKVQQLVKDKFNIVLSAKIYQCEIVCLGQEEPSATIEFIQYPKFQIEEEKLKNAILYFTEQLQTILEQNRVVIVFNDETIMLEKSSNIDPAIKL